MQITRDLLRRYAEDRCSPEEIQAIEEWLEDRNWPDWKKDIPVASGVKNSIWNKIDEGMEPVSIEPVSIKTHMRGLMRIAAIVLLVIMGAGMSVYYWGRHSRKNEVAYITGKDKRQTITLSDSSVVFLGPASSIRLLQPFSGNHREIVLNGEASFEVAKDPARPFTVISGAIRTTALGTSFKVMAPANGNSVHVALSSGKVVVCNQPDKEVVDQLFLDPGEGVTYERAGHLKKTEARQYNYKTDILYFRDADVKEVMDKLTAFYHIQIQYDELKASHWQVSGEFDYQPLDIVLQNIAYTCDIRYALEKNALICRKK